ncbi:MAG: hypothetical protein QM762_07850 [Chryseolinea sp.]
MGLDSVTLIVDVERHFGISISNQEAERIYTVQDFADCIFSRVILHPDQKCKSQILFYKCREFLTEKLGVRREDISPGTKLNQLIPVSDLKSVWTSIQLHFLIKLPDLSRLDFDPNASTEVTFFDLKVWTRKKPVTTGTVGDLVNWMLSLNHEKFLNPRNLCDKSDIERIVSGIISESCGVPIDEIRLHHRITDDLGID